MNLRLRLAALALMFLTLAACGTSSQDEPSEDADTAHLIGHVHGLGVNPSDGALYAAGHYGVFRIQGGTPERVADRWQDTMAFTVAGPDTFLASGHPDMREDLPPHLGLIESTDGAETWKHLSLQGEADFHALEVVGDRIFGYDAARRRLMTTTDGRTWQTVATGAYVDLAALPSRPDRVPATRQHGTVEVVRLDGTVRPAPRAPELVMIGSAPGGVLGGMTASGEVYNASAATGPWRKAGQVPGSPAALALTDDAWYVATDQAILSSRDDGATWSVVLGASG